MATGQDPLGAASYSPPVVGASGPRAGFWQRVGASLVDGIILGVLNIVLTAALKALGYALAVLIAVAYIVYFEGGPTGQTIGKRALGHPGRLVRHGRTDRLWPGLRPLCRQDHLGSGPPARLPLDALGPREAVLARQDGLGRRRPRQRLPGRRREVRRGSTCRIPRIRSRHSRRPPGTGASTRPGGPLGARSGPTRRSTWPDPRYPRTSRL